MILLDYHKKLKLFPHNDNNKIIIKHIQQAKSQAARTLCPSILDPYQDIILTAKQLTYVFMVLLISVLNKKIK